MRVSPPRDRDEADPDPVQPNPTARLDLQAFRRSVPASASKKPLDRGTKVQQGPRNHRDGADRRHDDGLPMVPAKRASPSVPSPLSAYSGATGTQNLGKSIRLTGVPTNPRKDSGGFRLHAGCTTNASYTLAPNTTDTITE